MRTMCTGSKDAETIPSTDATQHSPAALKGYESLMNLVLDDVKGNHKSKLPPNCSLVPSLSLSFYTLSPVSARDKANMCAREERNTDDEGNTSSRPRSP